MKTFILVLIFIIGVFYYYVPNDTKVELFEKVGLDSSIFVSSGSIDNVEVKGGLIDVKFDSSNKSTYKGNISAGEVMTDLSWAQLQYVKCFTKDESVNFNGNVVLHKVWLPKNKTLLVKMIKDSPELNLSIYVYKTSLNNELPPNVKFVYDCLKDFSINETKTIDMKGNTAPSEVIIGVSGANGALDGGYSLELEQK
ncbi:MAG: hypothetical protein Q8K30_01595 [Candidatus Gracilibacteria bacterium]|nr:hypothetical protein [Candidatus Gracilibacteria bacterium]